jgi:hypothetical protein
LKEVAVRFKELRPKSWQELKDWYHALSLGWVFRGQRKADWEISSSLERLLRRVPLRAMEVPMLRKFASRLHHYAGSEAASETLLGKLALMQHHGVPTRLTDWTKSAFVATFFAVEEAVGPNGACAVWALVGEWCNTQSVHRLRAKLGLTADQLPMEISLAEDHHFIEYVFNAGEPCVVSLEPERLNPRMAAQQGIFVCAGDMTSSFMENLEALGARDLLRKLYKIIIPNAWRPRILHDRERMNIGPDSLFPGLDGYCRSIKLRFSRLDDSSVSQDIAGLWQKYGFDVPA